jgi:hypothetical protein
MKKLTVLITIIFLSLLVAGCQANPNAPIQTVETYLSALVAKDENTLVSHSCKEWENKALLEYDSFGNVTTELKDLSCRLTGQSTNAQNETVFSVNCTGFISASYNGELRSFDLGKRIYRVVERNGSLQICGY